MEDILNLDDYNFDKNVIENEGVVLVDFWAVWCGPCKILSPIIEEVAKEIKGEVLVAKVNVDENPIVSSRYKIMSIPSILIFKSGKIVDQMMGAQPKEEIIKRLKSALK